MGVRGGRGLGWWGLGVMGWVVVVQRWWGFRGGRVWGPE